jgi:hypothetical protein
MIKFVASDPPLDIFDDRSHPILITTKTKESKPMSAVTNSSQSQGYSSGNAVSSGSKPSTYFFWRICAWSGPVFLLGYLVSWAILGYNIPPFEPSISIGDLHAHYVNNSVRIRLAFVLSVFFMPFYFVFSSVVSRIMQKIEGSNGPLSIVEQMGGATTVVVGLVAGVCWLTAGFRVEERTPEIIRVLHDFGWLFFDTTYMCTSLQMVAMGCVFVNDKRSEPLVPRWFSWFSFFVAASFLPLTLLPFFYSGPFAWSGAFCYWVSLGAFFLWTALICIYVFKAIDKLEQEDAASA